MTKDDRIMELEFQLRQLARNATNNQVFWLRAAREALAGKPAALRNRVAMYDAPAAELIASDAS